MQYPNVADAVVVATAHEVYGEMVIAIINVVKGCTVQPADLKQRLARRCKADMSPYMIPRKFYFVQSIPRTVNGKVDYVRLESMTNSELSDWTVEVA